MVRTTGRGYRCFLGTALLATVTLGSLEPAIAGRQVPPRPVELGVPLHVGDLVTGVVEKIAHPQRNRAPRPNFVPTCASNWRSAECTRVALAAIRRALASEGVRRWKLVLPRNYRSLTVGEQTFVITDLERVARGLKPFAGLTRPFNSASHAAAVVRVDPNPAIASLRALGVSDFGSNWAGDFGPLASDYDWMYNDGYGSRAINLACLTPQSSGCWGHRDNIISTYPPCSQARAPGVPPGSP